MTMSIDEVEWADPGVRATLLTRVARARVLATNWICDRVDDDGRPAGADVANAWWRAPWSLAIGGRNDVAAAMMGWIEREALTASGEFRDGAYGPGGTSSPAYLLSPIALAAWLLGRYDTASTVMDTLESRWTDPESGGVYEFVDYRTDPLQDMLKTAQVGVSALVTGRLSTAAKTAEWLRNVYEAQPALPGRLYTSMRGGALVTAFSEASASSRVVRFDAARQAYFHPGIAAAFLAGYAQQADDPRALQLGADYLSLNKLGGAIQFDDPQSVQICKFGWGAAAMHAASPKSGHLPWVVRMAEWFVSRQNADGSWAPSSFMSPQPGLIDHFWKTSEHLMELSYIEQALRASGETRPVPDLDGSQQ